MAQILAIDDDPSILSMIKRILDGDGHCVTVLDHPDKIKDVRLNVFDLVLLDVMMPGLDGFSLCSSLRGVLDCPILFLTAKTGEADLVAGLASGADDYICKPFGKLELRARVSAHLRRERRDHTVKLSFDECCFNLSAKQLTVHGDAVALTRGEYQICEFLARNAGQVFSREQIFEAVFGFDSDSSDSTVSTHIKNIRAKLEQLDYSPIKTVWGIGYKWEE